MGSEFFVPTRAFTVGDVAQLTGAQLLDASKEALPISGLASLDEPVPGSLVFITSKRSAALISSTPAAAVLCPADVAELVAPGAAALVHRNPQRAFAQVGRAMFPETALPVGATAQTGVSEASHVDPSAQIEDGATVEAGAVIGARVAIGRGTVVAANAVIGSGCQIGRDCYIGPNATVRYALIGDRVIIHSGASVGKDGFGFVFGENGPERMPQLGRVILQDGVEIGANSTVDRGGLTDTVIGENTKIDNLVQIAHNVKIGRNCVIAGHCGLSGSVTLGDYVMLGGRVGIADHVKIGSGVQLAAMAGVMDNIPDNERWAGAPAVPVREWFRQISVTRKLAGRKGGGTDERGD